LEELILHYYLKIFNFFIIIFIIFFSLTFYYSINKKNIVKKEIFSIQKQQKIESIFKQNLEHISYLDILFIKTYYHLNYFLFNKYIHYGDFKVSQYVSVIDLFKIISKPSNVLSKITIVEGWSKIQLYEELSKYFNEFDNIPYEEILADTYYFDKNIGFESFVKNLKKVKSDYFFDYKNNNLYQSFSEEEIITIGSLLEKEGINFEDKKSISSVIFNRLIKNMKLQIDATVLYAITDGKYNLGRKLLFNDLKFDDPYNTYIYRGLPPKPISYVGKKTLDIVFKNHKSEFLFYFFDNSLNRHKFSKTYKEHKAKLDEYRKNQ
tara:strand:+ start:358 stop:1320 length:963 start_codon:yes stop_codon:yes gene_type:complete